MARPRKSNVDPGAIAAERVRLQAELARLDQVEREARERARDAGRETLMNALTKVRVAAMTKDDAKIIAQAIAAQGASQVVLKLSA